MTDKLVVYDSFFGNTAKIAEAIGEALGDAVVINVSDLTQEHLVGVNILFVGSPTRAFRPTPKTVTFLKGLDADALSDVKAAAFDTRIPPESIESALFRWFVPLMGYADKIIARLLTKAGADLALQSEGFAVLGTEGPLAEGELERAKTWAKEIL